MGEPRQVKNNGVLVWQVNKVVTEIVYVENPDGTRTQVKKKVRLRGTAPTKNLARQRLDQRYKEYLVKTGELPVEALGLAPSALTMTVGEWLETWFKRRANSGEVQASSLNRYRGLLDNHILPAVGDKPLRMFTLADINRLMLETLPNKTRHRLNPQTGEFEDTGERLLNNSPMRKVQDIFTQSMKMALVEGKIRSNPMDGFKRISKQGMADVKKATLADLTGFPAQIVAALFGTPDMGRWSLALVGLRQAERLGVEFGSFVNLADRSKPAELHINRQLWYDENKKQFHIKHRTKTESGERILILPERVREALLDWQAQRNEWAALPTWKPLKGLENLFFTTKTGKPIRHQVDGADFRRMLRKHGLRDDVWLHALRHLVATELGIQGVHQEIAKTILGHHSTAMTSYYQHFNKSATRLPLGQVSDAFHHDVPQVVLAVADQAVAYGVNGFYDALMDGNLPKPSSEQEQEFMQTLDRVQVEEVHKQTLKSIAESPGFTDEEHAALDEYDKRRNANKSNPDVQTVEWDDEWEAATVVVDDRGEIQSS